MRLLRESQLGYNRVTPYRLMAYSLIGSLLDHQTIKFITNYAVFRPNFPINSTTSADLIDAIAASNAPNENSPP